MRTYELALITDSSIEESVRDGVTERVESIVVSAGGSLGEQATWGRRSLIYPIDHHSEGFYSFHRFQAEPATVTELDRVLSIADEVLRFKIVRLPERAMQSGKAPLLRGAAR
ncbi:MULTISPECIES: 30S ribosomal protein S6 [Ferrimicrobium]|uniref:Small ribosomal subunit protein bS6 n=1 Tax=Ferrimicrobium acidiphilum TaxID=121039 RepID=A0ABV3Y3U5_9ACTN|nr:30S ribosomal protein S6 [Ferrimicrobium sp.]MCL5973318.1 30S ribosomal protein S6 [Actinomycetota bacterium]